jgi:hypothetical protein
MFRLAVWHDRLARYVAEADEPTKLELSAAYLDVLQGSKIKVTAQVPGHPAGTFTLDLD